MAKAGHIQLATYAGTNEVDTRIVLENNYTCHNKTDEGCSSLSEEIIANQSGASVPCDKEEETFDTSLGPITNGTMGDHEDSCLDVIMSSQLDMDVFDEVASLISSHDQTDLISGMDATSPEEVASNPTLTKSSSSHTKPTKRGRPSKLQEAARVTKSIKSFFILHK